MAQKPWLKQWSRSIVVGGLIMVALAVACGGGAPPPAAPAPQQLQQPAQPVPAAPASEPQPAAAPAALAPAKPAEPPKPAAPAAKEPKYGGIFTLPLRQYPPGGWDITAVSQRNDIVQAGAPLWSRGHLVRECSDEVTKPCPGLAESWEIANDFKEYTFKIRNGVFWHDGTPFSAQDAKFWLDLIYFGAQGGGKTRRPAFWAADLGPATKVEVLDGNRVRITMKERDQVMLDKAINPIYMIGHPRHLAASRIAQGEVAITPKELGLVGVGPFKLLNDETGVRVQVRRFDKYWEKSEKGQQLPFLDGIDFIVMRDPQAMHAALRVGRLDGGTRAAGYYLDRETKAVYQRELGDKIQIVDIPWGAATGYGLGWNLLRAGPWQDVRVRKAVSLWLDRQASVEVLHGGEGYVGSIMNPGLPFAPPDFLTWPGYNPATREKDRAEAKRLMAEAGYANGFTATYPCNRQVIVNCEYFQGQLAGLGITLKLSLLDPAGWTAANQTPDWDTVTLAVGVSPVPEAYEFQYTRYSTSKNTLFKHEDPKIPEFFARLRAATRFEERVKIWHEFERYVVLDQAYILTFSSRRNLTPYRSYVKGMVIPNYGVLSHVDFAPVWLDK